MGVLLLFFISTGLFKSFVSGQNYHIVPIGILSNVIKYNNAKLYLF